MRARGLGGWQRWTSSKTDRELDAPCDHGGTAGVAARIHDPLQYRLNREHAVDWNRVIELQHMLVAKIGAKGLTQLT